MGDVIPLIPRANPEVVNELSLRLRDAYYSWVIYHAGPPFNDTNPNLQRYYSIAADVMIMHTASTLCAAGESREEILDRMEHWVDAILNAAKNNT